MTDRIPVKANFTGSDVTSLGEFASNDSIPIAHGGTGAINAAAARTALGVDQSGTALLKAGGALTGAVTTNSTFDGRDVAADGVTADAALPKAGGTMSGGLAMGANTITSTGKILFSNMYAAVSDLPSASTYHGMFAHVHATGKGYFAHGGAWIELANQTDLASTTTTAGAALAKAGGAMTGAITTNSTFDGRDVGADGTKLDTVFPNIPQNSKSAAYTLVLGDAGKHIFHPAADTTARTFTIPANASVAYPIGTAVTFINMTAAVVSIAITTDVMYLSEAGTTGTRSLARYGSATAVKITATNWVISGSGLT